jgi:hypothetical protein
MPRIDCLACGRPIPAGARVCPKCGNPRQTCYVCPEAPAEQCQGCGVLSCLRHLRATYMLRAGQYPFAVPLTERFCRRCYFEARAKQWLVGTFAAVVFAVILACVAWAVVDRHFYSK